MLACHPSAAGDPAESLLQTAPLWQGSCIGSHHSRQHTGRPRPLVQLAARAVHPLSLHSQSTGHLLLHGRHHLLYVQETDDDLTGAEVLGLRCLTSFTS